MRYNSSYITYTTICEPGFLYDKKTPEPVEIVVKPAKSLQRDDLLYKGLLEDLFQDFLCFMVPDAPRHFDFSRGFSFLNKELDQLFPPEGDEYKPKIIDKLVKVYSRKGTEEWVLVHLEVQDKYGKDFSARMFSYFARIYDKYQKPVTAFAILTEPIKKTRSNSFSLSYVGTTLNYTFNILKIANQNDQELEASDNPFAMALLIAKAALQGKRLSSGNKDAFLLEVKMKLAKQLLSKKMAKSKIDALLNFLTYYIRFANAENNSKFEQELNKITGRNTTMGIRELLVGFGNTGSSPLLVVTYFQTEIIFLKRSLVLVF